MKLLTDSFLICILPLAVSSLIQFTGFLKIRPLFRQMIATLVLGFPILVYGLLNKTNDLIFIGVTFTNPGITITLGIIFSTLAIFSGYIIATRHLPANSSNREFQRQSLSKFILESLSWFSYLLVYEFLLRGFLLFSFLQKIDVVTAISINLIIYALAHVLNGKKELLMSIPFGLILCIITIYTENFWCAFFIHSALALSVKYYATTVTFASEDGHL